MGAGEVILAGGAELYALLLPQVTRMSVSYTHLDVYKRQVLF